MFVIRIETFSRNQIIIISKEKTMQRLIHLLFFLQLIFQFYSISCDMLNKVLYLKNFYLYLCSIIVCGTDSFFLVLNNNKIKMTITIYIIVIVK